MTEPVNIPSLSELIADPGKVRALPGPTAHHLLIQLTCLLPLLVSKAHGAEVMEKAQPDRLLGIEEAASILGKSIDAIYRHADDFPFTVRDGRSLRFSSRGIQAYIRQRVQHGRPLQ